MKMKEIESIGGCIASASFESTTGIVSDNFE